MTPCFGLHRVSLTSSAHCSILIGVRPSPPPLHPSPPPLSRAERGGSRSPSLACGGMAWDGGWERGGSSAPAEGGAGSKRIVLGCDPGAGCSTEIARVLTCASTVASPKTGAPVPRSGAPSPWGEGEGMRDGHSSAAPFSCRSNRRGCRKTSPACPNARSRS